LTTLGATLAVDRRTYVSIHTGDRKGRPYIAAKPLPPTLPIHRDWLSPQETGRAPMPST
jgi:hypothetical protein